jgi:hypothetical protein
MQGFNDWAERHCTVFGLLDERQMAMVASWEKIFDGCGWRAEELHAATTWLASHRPPRFPSEHLPALQTRLREQRETVDIEARSAAQRERWEREQHESEDAGGMAALVDGLRKVREKT